MKALLEDVWASLPDALEPYELKRRGGFLLAHAAPGQRVLDFGCGEGAFCALLARAGASPVGVDRSELGLERARARHPDLDFHRIAPEGPLPFEDGSFDLVWASEVLAFVVDTAAVMSELRRVLRSEGRLLVTTPFHGRIKDALLALWNFERRFDPRSAQVRFYTPRSLRDLLLDFGFNELEVATAGGPPPLRRLLLANGRRARVVAA